MLSKGRIPDLGNTMHSITILSKVTLISSYLVIFFFCLLSFHSSHNNYLVKDVQDEKLTESLLEEFNISARL